LTISPSHYKADAREKILKFRKCTGYFCVLCYLMPPGGEICSYEADIAFHHGRLLHRRRHLSFRKPAHVRAHHAALPSVAPGDRLLHWHLRNRPRTATDPGSHKTNGRLAADRFPDRDLPGQYPDDDQAVAKAKYGAVDLHRAIALAICIDLVGVDLHKALV
jgi:hypothetical protein